MDAVTRLQLLSAKECTTVLERVLANRESWSSRYPGLPFYTLGAASYLDSGPSRRDAYFRKAAAANPLLVREFGWLYDRLLDTLGNHLRSPVRFEPRAARPGFHIALAHEAFRRPLGKVHFDLQFTGIEWADENALDFSRPVSFTLAVRLPRSGAGLHTWDASKEEWDAMTPEDRERIPQDRAPAYVAYREGEMVCHSGMLLHRIAPAQGQIHADDMRLTLQGHALPGRDGYRLYW